MGQDVAVPANPIERIVYTDSLPDEVFCISGVNALSEYSMLNKEKMTLMPLQRRSSTVANPDRQGIWRDPHRDMALQSMFFSKRHCRQIVFISGHEGYG